MVTLIAMRETGWIPARLESFMWRQLAAAYGARHRLVGGKSPGEPCDLEEAFGVLADGGKRVFLDPWEGESLRDFQHPAEAVYVFGRAGDDCRRWRRPEDLVVRIHTPQEVDLFATHAASIVLQDRSWKHGN